MTFDEILDQVRELLRKRGRLSYQSLQVRFNIDEQFVGGLKGELIDAERVAQDEDGKVLVWVGADSEGEKGKRGKGEKDKTAEVASSQFSVASPQPLTPSPQPLAPNLFRPEGEYWAVSFAGETCRLKEARGLHFLAHLLQQPHQEVHVITLSTVDANLREEPTEASPYQDASLSFDHTEGFSDAGEMLDPQARAAYKQRLSELREELEEARQFHDLGRSERLAAEIDCLTRELTRAVGLGGRLRRMGSPAERARVNITRAIKVALRKITEHHPTLGHHLATTIKTGTYCSYSPDARMPITWQ